MIHSSSSLQSSLTGKSVMVGENSSIDELVKKSGSFEQWFNQHSIYSLRQMVHGFCIMANM